MLDNDSRNALKEEYPPQFEKFIGHHVTVKFGARDTDPEPEHGEYWVVGYAYEKERRPNGSGIEALIVSIKYPHESRGHTERDDGEVYHITWSLGAGYTPKDSKRVAKQGWQKRMDPIKINMEPAFMPFNR